MFLSENCKES